MPSPDAPGGRGHITSPMAADRAISTLRCCDLARGSGRPSISTRSSSRLGYRRSADAGARHSCVTAEPEALGARNLAGPDLRRYTRSSGGHDVNGHARSSHRKWPATPCMIVPAVTEVSFPQTTADIPSSGDASVPSPWHGRRRRQTTVGPALGPRCRAQEASSGKRASKAARDIGQVVKLQRLGIDRTLGRTSVPTATAEGRSTCRQTGSSEG